MKTVIAFVSLMVISSVAFAMGSTGQGGCYKTQSCYNVWQCYGSCVSDCQKEAKALVDPKANPRGYWDAVGACQARACAQFIAK